MNQAVYTRDHWVPAEFATQFSQPPGRFTMGLSTKLSRLGLDTAQVPFWTALEGWRKTGRSALLLGLMESPALS